MFTLFSYQLINKKYGLDLFKYWQIISLKKICIVFYKITDIEVALNEEILNINNF